MFHLFRPMLLLTAGTQVVLADLDGEVVGINSWILSGSGGYIGLSFSIPIEVAMGAVEQLRKYGKVSRGLLGVVVGPVTREMAER
jgi:serine protease Do